MALCYQPIPAGQAPPGATWASAMTEFCIRARVLARSGGANGDGSHGAIAMILPLLASPIESVAAEALAALAALAAECEDHRERAFASAVVLQSVVKSIQTGAPTRGLAASLLATLASSLERNTHIMSHEPVAPLVTMLGEVPTTDGVPHALSALRALAVTHTAEVPEQIAAAGGIRHLILLVGSGKNSVADEAAYLLSTLFKLCLSVLVSDERRSDVCVAWLWTTRLADSVRSDLSKSEHATVPSLHSHGSQPGASERVCMPCKPLLCGTVGAETSVRRVRDSASC